VTKEVYNPKEHAENDKAVGSKKVTKEKAKATQAKATETPPEKTKTYKINKYGFLHCDKDLAKYLGVEFGKDKQDVPVEVERIEGGFTVRVVKA
jgi:hypothetical protein